MKLERETVRLKVGWQSLVLEEDKKEVPTYLGVKLLNLVVWAKACGSFAARLAHNIGIYETASLAEVKGLMDELSLFLDLIFSHVWNLDYVGFGDVGKDH